MDHLPYPLHFMHKYNLHKLLGLVMDDHDLPAIARIYGVDLADLEQIEITFNKTLSKLVQDLQKCTQPASPLDRRCLTLALGDSITSDRESYVKILNRLWKDDPSRQISDCGISGDTTSKVVDRFYLTALGETFDWAIIFLGTNDCRELDDEAHISNVGFEEYRRNLEYFTDSFLVRDKHVIHVTLPPVDNNRFRRYFPDTNWTYSKDRIEKTNDFIRNLSKRKNTGLADLAERLGTLKDDVLEEDGLHLNKHGQLILCETLLDILP